ncbi:hypothetical protein AGR1B_Lc10167 [Agrobacterium fabacearum S56]|nr:hypothetical protein AGR1B_Lc10167 [Agrobacterium fabacearum S56]
MALDLRKRGENSLRRFAVPPASAPTSSAPVPTEEMIRGFWYAASATAMGAAEVLSFFCALRRSLNG